MRKLTILFDADDVAEDLLSLWVGLLNRKYGSNVSPDDVTDWNVAKFFPGLDDRQVFGVLDEPGIWRDLLPMDGAVEALTKLRSDGHDLYLVTNTDYRHCREKFDRILEFFPFLDSRRIIITANKQMVSGDILIDDAPFNLDGGPWHKILFDRPHNRKWDENEFGAVRVRDWAQIYTLITEFSEHGKWPVEEDAEVHTTYEYLKALPKDIFRATLTGLMGFPLSSVADDFMARWLCRPWEENFPGGYDPFQTQNSQKDTEDRLKELLKGYCELCDQRNQILADQMEPLQKSEARNEQ